MIQLKPCPFCGGEAMLISSPRNGTFYIQCCSCTAMIGRKRKIVSSMVGREFFESNDEVIEEWNRRYEDGK